MNKKGILPKNMLSLILTVLGIALVMVAIFWAYRIFFNAEGENAKNIINSIEGKVNLMKTGESTSSILQGFKSSKKHGWSIVGWGRYVPGRPDRCFFKSCICICPDIVDRRDFYDGGAQFLTTWEDYAAEIPTKCQSEGICRFFNVDNIITIDNYVWFESLTPLPIAEKLALESSAHGIAIKVPESYLFLNITKTKNTIILNHTDTNYFKHKDVS